MLGAVMFKNRQRGWKTDEGKKSGVEGDNFVDGNMHRNNGGSKEFNTIK